MITIKFRGLRIDGKGWVYGGYFQHTPDEDGVRYYIFDFNEGAVEVIPESVGQFTVLHDKNGKEIFEGEILYNNDRKENCVVKYDEEKAMFIVEYLESKDKFTLWESISNLYYSVGNICENQELLENKLSN